MQYSKNAEGLRLYQFNSLIIVFFGGIIWGRVCGWTGVWVGGWVKKNKFVFCRWMGLITTSLELYCINYFGGIRKNTFVCFTVGCSNCGVEF